MLVIVAAFWGGQLAAQLTVAGTYTGQTLNDSINVATSATFTGGTNFTGPNATLGDLSSLFWNQNGTLVGKTITSGNTIGYYGHISVGANNSLTLDSATTLTGDVYLTGTTGSTIINQGAITHKSGTGYVSAPAFTNQGSITSTGGGVLSVGYSTSDTTINATGASITVNGNSSIYLNSILNQGTLNASNSGWLIFQGNNTTASLGTVTLATGGRALLNGTLDNTNATLAAPSGGKFELYAGTIKNGTIASGALGFTNSGGTLNNVAYTGDFSLPASTSATFTGGTTFTGANLSLGNYATLNWNQNGTLAGKTITSGTTTGNYGYISVGTNNSLTLDSATTLTGDVYVSGTTGATITNQGTITHNSGSGYLYAPTLINQGTITANTGTNLYVGYYSSYNTTNASGGTITANGTNANVYLQGIQNQGTLSATNAGQLVFQGNNTTASLGAVTLATGGRALLNGTLDNTSATLPAPTGGKYELYGGTINNGTIGTGALGFTSSGGTLNNVSFTGDLSLAGSTSVTFTGGTTFTGANLSLGNYATLNWNQNGTLAGKTITSGTTTSYYGYISVGANNSLTLDSATTLTGDVYLYGTTGATITNQGTITHNSGSGYLYAPTFVNQGAITANTGTNLYVGYYSSYNTTNASGGTITANGTNANVYLQGIQNQGTLSATNSGQLIFQGNNMTASLGAVTLATGGRALLNGILDNTAATLASPTGGKYELYGGTINNGTIGTGALGFTNYGGTLNNVAYTGDLSLPASTSATFTGGTTFTGANLSLGNYATLNWNQNGTLAGKTITSGTTTSYYGYISVGANNSLTLDSATTLTGDVYLYGTTGATITNQGTITHNSGSGYLYAPTFVNQGAITANTGTNLYVGYYSSYNTTNASGGTITANGTNANVYLQGIQNQGTLSATNAGQLVFQGNSTTAGIGSVTLATGGRALLNGTLDNTSATLTAPSGGKFELYGGTINNGTIGANALSFTTSGGTLNNVTYTGDLSLGDSLYAYLTGGTTFTGANLKLGNYASLYWNQNGTLAGKAITSGTTTGNYGYISVGTNNSLTLDSATTLTGDVYVSGTTGATITNQGTITHNSGTGYLYAPTLINQGTITANTGANLHVGYYSSYSTTNASGGTIAANGTNANVYLQGIQNQGTLSAANAGQLFFQGTNTTASLGSVTLSTGGRALLNGTLDNTSATLTAPSGGPYELYGGTINNGTIGANALGFTTSGGTLNNVTYTGDVSLPASSYATISGGTSFTGANLTLGGNSGLYWQQVGTLAGKTITFGANSYLYVTGTNNTLTLDNATTATGDVSIYTNGSSGTAITNQGTLNHNSTSTGYLYAPTLTNQGTINITAGTLYLGYYSNYATSNAAGGTINVNGGSAYVYAPLSNAGTLNIQSGTLYTNSYVNNTGTGLIKGSGTIYGNLPLPGGTIAPGNSIGNLTLANSSFTVTGTSTFAVELSGATADQLIFQNPTATVNIGSGLLNLSLTLLSAPVANSTYTLMTITSGLNTFAGSFAGLPVSGSGLVANFSGVDYGFTVNYLPTAITLTAVPEPGTCGLLGTGLLLLVGWRGFRGRSSCRVRRSFRYSRLS